MTTRQHEVQAAGVLERICELAKSELEIEAPISARTRLVEDLGLDSMQLLTLAVEVENQFRVCIDPEDEATIECLGDLARVVASKLSLDASEREEGAAR